MGALISDCKQYRYWLTRPVDTMYPKKGPVLFVILNPSTADNKEDDPTIRKCRGYAAAWGCDGLSVANLYAYRATDPRILWNVPYPVGPRNDKWLMSLARELTHVVCAWGTMAQEHRVSQFCLMMRELGITLWCLGMTKSGAPRHPLYLKSTQPLVKWHFESVQQDK